MSEYRDPHPEAAAATFFAVLAIVVIVLLAALQAWLEGPPSTEAVAALPHPGAAAASGGSLPEGR